MAAVTDCRRLPKTVSSYLLTLVLRYFRFPPVNNTNGKGKKGRGIGSHTDYGLLVIAAQDEVGGLFIRPPYEDESYANWQTSSAGMAEDDHRWVYVPPVPNTFTVFPGE